jgi:serine/threonine-protein kinase
MIPCPSRAELQDLLAERLTAARERAVLTHIETCTACQALLEELTADCAPGSPVTLLQDPVPASGEPAQTRPFLGELKAALPRWHSTIPPAAAAAATELPARLGRYELHEEIGRGGMGCVLRGHDPELGRDLAVKVLLADHQNDPGVVSRFTEEAQIGGQLQHPGIVPVYELGRSADQRPFFAMKLVRGRTLAELLHERAGPGQDLPRLLHVFEQVCQTLAYAHSRGVIHRDLKPANVMVGAFGEVQVMDWGLAKVLGERRRAPEGSSPAVKDATGGLEDAPAVVRTARSVGLGPASRRGHALGTPAYMAPEQAAGEVDRLDERCDVFGLGAILCEILTGQPPYPDADGLQVLLQAGRAELGEAFARLDACGADAELIALAKSSLAAQADQRPRDAGVLAAQLAAHRESMEARLRQAELAQAEARTRAAEERKRRRLAVGLAAALLALGVGAATAGLWYQHDRAQRASAQARRDHDEALRRGQLEGSASPAAAEAEALRRRALRLTDDPAQWQATLAAALAASRQAQALLDQVGEAATPALRQRVEQLGTALEADERDRALVAGIDDVRVEQSSLSAVGQRLKGGETFPPLRVALERYGLRVGDAKGAVALVGGRPRPVREKLVAGLDFCLVHTPRGQTEARAWLLAVLAGVDGDSWRTQARQAAGRGDRPALARLLRRAEAARQPPELLALLAVVFLDQDSHKLALLRRAQQSKPGDFWVNHNLGYALSERFNPSRLNRAVTADALPALEEAIGFLRAALAVRPRSAVVYLHIGNALQARGDGPGAVAAFRAALDIDPRYAKAHTNLGSALRRQGDLAGAVAACRTAVEIEPRLAPAHTNLGAALWASGDVTGAIACYRAALVLDPNDTKAHANLGAALWATGDVHGAVAACRAALAIDPEDVPALTNLGVVLLTRGDAAGAAAAFGKAIEIDPKLAQPHNGLGQALVKQGRFAQASAALRRYLELLPANDPGRKSGTQRLRHYERFEALDRKLPDFLSGAAKPADVAERFALAQVCQCKQLYGRSARFYAETFDEQSELGEDLQGGFRHDAACVAALAGCGLGKDADSLNEKERSRWRRQARRWLRADLVLLGKLLERGKPGDLLEVQKLLGKWQAEAGLAGVRGEKAIARLPAEERPGWVKLWVEVEALRKKAEEKRE